MPERFLHSKACYWLDKKNIYASLKEIITNLEKLNSYECLSLKINNRNLYQNKYSYKITQEQYVKVINSLL